MHIQGRSNNSDNNENNWESRHEGDNGKLNALTHEETELNLKAAPSSEFSDNILGFEYFESSDSVRENNEEFTCEHPEAITNANESSIL